MLSLETVVCNHKTYFHQLAASSIICRKRMMEFVSCQKNFSIVEGPSKPVFQYPLSQLPLRSDYQCLLLAVTGIFWYLCVSKN